MADNKNRGLSSLLKKLITGFTKSTSTGQTKEDKSTQNIPSINNIPLEQLKYLDQAINDNFFSTDFNLNDRYQRYNQYHIILQRIPEQARALAMVQDLVLNPEKITNEYIIVNEKSDQLTPLGESSKEKIKYLINLIKLEEILPQILFNLLLYGDQYVEILYTNKVYKIPDSDSPTTKKDIGLIIHDPKNIVIVKDENDNIYGYVEIKDIEDQDEEFFNNKGQLFNELINRIKKLPNNKNLFSNMPNSVFDKGSNEQLNDASDKFRFIPEKSMAHFRYTTNNLYYPYGSSYFEPVRPMANMILLTELSVLVYRLIRQPAHIKYKLDVSGIDPIQYPGYIQTMKQLIRSERTLRPDMLNQPLDQQVNLVTMFDDYWIPVKNDRPLYDMEWFEGKSLQGQIDDLNYLHKKLISQLGLPPTYLGYQEEDSRVATTMIIQDRRTQRMINKIQKDVSTGIKTLLSKIQNILELQANIDNVNIMLQPITISSEEISVMDSKMRLVSSMVNLGINKKFALKSVGYSESEIRDMLKKDEEESEE